MEIPGVVTPSSSSPPNAREVDPLQQRLNQATEQSNPDRIERSGNTDSLAVAAEQRRSEQIISAANSVSPEQRELQNQLDEIGRPEPQANFEAIA